MTSLDMNIEKWCHYFETTQDFADVCLITKGVTTFSKDSDEGIYKYYGWYRITNNGSFPRKSVYRRIRRALYSEGYPDGVIVIDPYTSKELGLEPISFKGMSDHDRREHFHYRNTSRNIASEKLEGESKLEGMQAHLDRCGKKSFAIRGFPIYDNADISIEPVGKCCLRALIGRTIKHPDYALRSASVIALISIIVALIGLGVSAISLVLALQPDAAVLESLGRIEKQLANSLA